MKKVIILFSTASIFLIILILFVFFRFNDNKLHLVFCDVGQGDAVYIRTVRQADILIDGGPDSKVLDCLGRHMPFWDRSLDLVIMTHPDADHSTGLIDVIDRYQVSYFYTESVPGKTEVYKRLEAILAEKNLSAKYLHSGAKISDNTGFSMTTLWPSVESISKVNQNVTNLRLNEFSVVQLLSYGNFKALLTGDIGYLVMDQIAGEAGFINILKVPHHGSKTGMSEHSVSVMDPDISVISVGKGNSYGHPAKISLDLLENQRSNVLRTDKMGDIEIISDGKIFYFKTKK